MPENPVCLPPSPSKDKCLVAADAVSRVNPINHPSVSGPA